MLLSIRYIEIDMTLWPTKTRWKEIINIIMAICEKGATSLQTPFNYNWYSSGTVLISLFYCVEFIQQNERWNDFIINVYP